MARKTKVKPAPKVTAPDPFEAVKQAPGDGVSVPSEPKPRKDVTRNLPHDPVTGKPLPPPKRVKPEPKSLQDAAQSAFQDVGGEAWLRKQAREFPKEFMSLLVRIAGEDGAAGGMTYVAVPIPVEQRELPGGKLEQIPQPIADEPDFLT